MFSYPLVTVVQLDGPYKGMRASFCRPCFADLRWLVRTHPLCWITA
jgi:hypothetical protein